MNKLITAGMARVWKDKVFWICMAVMFLCGSTICLKTDSLLPMNAVFFSFAVFSGIPIAVFCGLFTGTEYSNGTIRNKLLRHSRFAVYISVYMVNCIAGLLMAFGYILAALILGLPNLAPFQTGIDQILFYLLASAFMICANASIYTMICLLIPNKSNAAVACLLFSFILQITGVRIHSELSLLKTVAAAPDSSIFTVTKQTVSQFLFDFIPACQGMQISFQNEILPLQLPVYSACLILLTSGLGVFFFHKKDIK